MRIAPLMAAAQQYEYVPESGLQLKAMLGATRLAAKVLLEHDGGIAHGLKQRLEGLTTAQRSADHYAELEALRALSDALPDEAPSEEMSGNDVVRRMVKLVWMYVFMHYFWLKERRTVESPASQPGGAG